MINEIENIENNIAKREIEKETENVSLEELKEVYILHKYENEKRVHPMWEFAAILSIGTLIVTGILIWNADNTYPGTEFKNYKLFAQKICNISEAGPLQTFTVTEDFIRISCMNKRIDLYREE